MEEKPSHGFEEWFEGRPLFRRQLRLRQVLLVVPGAIGFGLMFPGSGDSAVDTVLLVTLFFCYANLWKEHRDCRKLMDILAARGLMQDPEPGPAASFVPGPREIVAGVHAFCGNVIRMINAPGDARAAMGRGGYAQLVEAFPALALAAAFIGLWFLAKWWMSG